MNLISKLVFFCMIGTLYISYNGYAEPKSAAKPVIVVTITPIASLVANLVRDKAEVRVLNKLAGCPHHHHAKPSDLFTLDDASVIIAIDPDFDHVNPKMTKNTKAIQIKISDFQTINFQVIFGTHDSTKNTSKKVYNWHFWLDLDNVLALQTELASSLSGIFPEMADDLTANLSGFAAQIKELKELKYNQMKDMRGFALLSDSLEHFFKGAKAESETNNASLRAAVRLDEVLRSESTKCIVLGLEQNPESYMKYGKPVIWLDSENWQLPHNYKPQFLEQLFVQNYQNMIHTLSKCK